MLGGGGAGVAGGKEGRSFTVVHISKQPKKKIHIILHFSFDFPSDLDEEDEPLPLALATCQRSKFLFDKTSYKSDSYIPTHCFNIIDQLWIFFFNGNLIITFKSLQRICKFTS